MQEQQAYREAFQLPIHATTTVDCKIHATTTVDCNEIRKGAHLLPQ